MEHTIFGLIKKRGELAQHHKLAKQAADAIGADLDAIDRALVLCGYQDDPKAIPMRGRYNVQFYCDAVSGAHVEHANPCSKRAADQPHRYS